MAPMFRAASQALALLAILLASLASHADGRILERPDGRTAQHILGGHVPPPTSYTRRLNFSSSAPHLFASAYGLLQQWSNTVFPNGHALAAATIPAYTLAYHGLRAPEASDDKGKDHNDDDLAPASPEWLALDLEMAYGIMGSTRRSWLLTYQTTRPVRVLYVDGESAALMGLGQLDSQMLLLYGNVSGPASRPRFGGLGDEYARARGLCDWLQAEGLRGCGWGYEGIVRMNAGFEVIWCDFLSDSLRLLSRLNVTAPLDYEEEEEKNDINRKDEDDDAADAQSYYTLPPVPTRTDRVADPSNPPAPPNWRGGNGRRGPPGRDEPGTGPVGTEPFLASQAWGWFESATWHYGGSRAGPGAGETRVRIDNCGILSYYALQFDNSALALARARDEQQRLNLTAEGYWEPGGAGGVNRTVALRQLSRRRRFHHLANASEEDALRMRYNAEVSLQRTLQRGGGSGGGGDAEDGPYPGEFGRGPGSDDGVSCSGAAWTLILAEIVQRVGRHLKTVEAVLEDGLHPSTPMNATATRAWLHRLRAQNHMFMVGYLAYPADYGSADADARVTWQPYSALFNSTLSLCRYRYTRLFARDDVPGSTQLPPEEEDLRSAVEETYGTLCEGLLGIGFDVERAWMEAYGGVKQEHEDRSEDLATAAALRWYDQLTELTAWLGWESEFIGCDRVCGWHERCYIPMWPMLHQTWGRGPPGGGGGRYGGPGGGGRYPGGRYPPFHRGSQDDGGDMPMPDFPRSRTVMGDDTDLWEPKCVETSYIMGR